jgi:hypothetical protein
MGCFQEWSFSSAISINLGQLKKKKKRIAFATVPCNTLCKKDVWIAYCISVGSLKEFLSSSYVWPDFQFITVAYFIISLKSLGSTCIDFQPLFYCTLNDRALKLTYLNSVIASVDTLPLNILWTNWTNIELYWKPAEKEFIMSQLCYMLPYSVNL